MILLLGTERRGRGRKPLDEKSQPSEQSSQRSSLTCCMGLIKDADGSLGVGLAMGTKDPAEMWRTLTTAFATAPEGGQNPMVLRGFLDGLSRSAPEKVSHYLDGAVTDSVLGSVFPLLQCSVDIDEAGASRIMKSLRQGLAPIEQYGQLSLGQATLLIAPASLQRVLLDVASRPRGLDVAIDILQMTFLGLRSNGLPIAVELVDCGCTLIRAHDFIGLNDFSLYQSVEVLKVCLEESAGEGFVQEMCDKLLVIISDGKARYDCIKIIKPLLCASPKIALSRLLLSEESQMVHELVTYYWSSEENPFEGVPIQDLRDWANEDPEIRYPALASITPLVVESRDGGTVSLSPVALGLLEAAPNTKIVLDHMQRNLRPLSWSGSRAAAIDRRRIALEPLCRHENQEIAEWALGWITSLAEWTEKERLSERREDERFE